MTELPKFREVYKGYEIEEVWDGETADWAVLEPGGTDALYVGELRSDAIRWINNRRAK